MCSLASPHSGHSCLFFILGPTNVGPLRNLEGPTKVGPLAMALLVP